MSKERLPRGVRRRGDSLVVSFALADGSIERRALGPVSVSYAVEQRAIYQRQVREGNYQKKQPRPKEKRRTVSDLWETYLDSYKLAGKKAAWRQEDAWAHLSPVFGALRPEQLTTAAVISYQKMRQAEGASNGTTNRETSALCAALTHAARQTVEGGKPLLERVPIFPSKLRESAPRSGFVTESQYKALAAVAQPLWLRAFLAAAFSFGFRRGELLNLRVRQIDFFGRWIILEAGSTKNGEGRKAAMTAELFELMKLCCSGKNPDDYVFTREDKTPVRDPRDEWQRACVAAGLGKFVPAKNGDGEEYRKYIGLTPHDLRRSAVRNMVRKAIPQSVAMKISGHKTAAVFRRYDICDEADLTEATRKIETYTPSIETDTKTDTKAIPLENTCTQKLA